MNLKFSFISTLLFCGVSLSGVAAGIVNIADHKIDQQHATAAVRAIIDSVEENTTIVFPKGTYHFNREGAAQIFCAITNNDNGVKCTPFPLIGKRNITIEGNGSEFIFHGRVLPFIMERSQGITLRGFTIDWADPFHLEGEVIAVDQARNCFTIKVPEGFRYAIHDGILNIVGEEWSVAAGQNIFWNKTTKAPYYNTQTFTLPANNIRAREIEKGVLELRGGKIKKFPPVGAIYVDKGAHLANRVTPAIRIYSCLNSSLTDITIYHAGAMGVIAERSENITITAMKISTRPGSARHVSTTADATHFANCKGDIIIRNSSFAHMLDDATNVHGTYLKVIHVKGNTVYAEPVHPHQFGYDFATVGDRVDFTDNISLRRVAEATVVKSEKIHDRYYRLQFDENMDGVVKSGFGIDNISWGASLTFSGNRVFENRARSILISTPGKVVVENNYFSSMMAAIRISGDVNFWYESGPVHDVTIRNNQFVDCNYGGGKFQAMIQIDPQIAKENLNANTPFHRNITIENNRIKSFDSPLLYACSVDGLVIRGNVAEKTHTYKPLYPSIPNFIIEACRNVEIKNNKIFGGKPTSKIEDNVVPLKSDL